MGEYGARLATLDCEVEEMLMRSAYQPQRCYLEVVDAERGIYRIPYDRAPEAYGVNIARIVPDEDAGEVVADPCNREALREALFDWTHRHLRSGARGRGRAVNRATVDVDSFPITVYGEQPGAAYNVKHSRRLWLHIEQSVSAFWSRVARRIGQLRLPPRWAAPRGARHRDWVPPPAHAHLAYVPRDRCFSPYPISSPLGVALTPGGKGALRAHLRTPSSDKQPQAQ